MVLTRCFVAIVFPDEVVEEIARIQEIIAKRSFTGKMTELANLHLTLKFLGELDESKIEIVRKKLKEVTFSPLNLRLGEMGTFASHGNPRIIWLKIEGNALWELQSKIDSILFDEGFKKENRFMAHVTLGRIKYVADKPEFRKHIKSIKPKKIDFPVKEFLLKKSDLSSSGPTYTDIETCSANQ